MNLLQKYLDKVYTEVHDFDYADRNYEKEKDAFYKTPEGIEEKRQAAEKYAQLYQQDKETMNSAIKLVEELKQQYSEPLSINDAVEIIKEVRSKFGLNVVDNLIQHRLIVKENKDIRDLFKALRNPSNEEN